MWPAGRRWEAQGQVRRSPRWYADCLLDLVRRRARDDELARFVVHAHGALEKPAAEALRSALESAFSVGRGRPAEDGDVELQLCDRALPAMWPTVARLAPLLDHRGVDDVVVLDCHDEVQQQDAARAVTVT